MTVARTFWMLLATSASLAACSSGPKKSAAVIEEPVPDAEPASDGGLVIDATLADNTGPPPEDASGLCGNSFFRAQQEPPNLYFVIDRSGSMSVDSKYSAMRVAAVGLVRKLGDTASFGAALFPGDPVIQGCEVGKEVMSTRPGDAPGAAPAGQDGPVTKAFQKATDVHPTGGTPTAATLQALVPTLQALAGKTVVVLMTDGGPNCNGVTPCAAADCTLNIEHENLGGHACDDDYNCCAPSIPGGPHYFMCLDAADTVAAVQALRAAGIATYVVGIPGSAAYAPLLDQLAVVGGTARPASPQYYRVDDMQAFSGILSQIGRKAIATCEFVLDQAPPDPTFVNVYLDQQVLDYDAVDGWTWSDSTKVTLHGQACERIADGSVGQVQVVAGCPTKLPR
jgi:hypothetical protein